MRPASIVPVVSLLLCLGSARAADAEAPAAPGPEELAKACGDATPGACAALGKLGRRHLHGDGVPVDPRRAAALLDKACAGADAPACVWLGSMLMRGEGVAQDLDRARQAFDRACGAEDPLACWELGLMYEYGQGVRMSVSRSLAYYERSCRAKNAYACAKLGSLYDEGVAPGTRADAAVRAADWWAVGCELGAPESCARLGEAFLAGKGRERDAVRAGDLFRKACAGGEKQACARVDAARPPSATN
jgi:TPR repeat protein